MSRGDFGRVDVDCCGGPTPATRFHRPEPVVCSPSPGDFPKHSPRARNSLGDNGLRGINIFGICRCEVPR